MLSATTLLFVTCDTTSQFQKIDFDWSKDWMSEISGGFVSKKDYKYWACLRSQPTEVERIDVLFEHGNSSNVDCFKQLSEGFYYTGHVSVMCYYLIIVNYDGSIDYIADESSLIEFFGKIDSMEEALLIAMINDFNIDYNNPIASSWRKTDNGYKFLLMKGTHEDAPNSFRQHTVRVKENGIVTSQKGKIYCEGFCECYKFDCNT